MTAIESPITQHRGYPPGLF